jgi:hypothetical protein
VRGGWHHAKDKVKYEMLSMAITPLPAPGFGGGLITITSLTEIEDEREEPSRPWVSSGWPSLREIEKEMKRARKKARKRRGAAMRRRR